MIGLVTIRSQFWTGSGSTWINAMSKIIRIESISDALEAFGFDKPEHPLVSVIPIDDRIVNYDYGDATYVLDFYQVSLKWGFSGEFQYGRNKYDFREGCVTFTKPGQAIQIKQEIEAKGASGWSLLFHADLITGTDLGQRIGNYRYFEYDVHEALQVSAKEDAAATDIVNVIQTEISQNIDKHSQPLIVSNIELLLKYCQRYYDRQFITRTNLNKDVITSFHQVVRNYYELDDSAIDGVLTVTNCAEELHLSPHYLGDLIKAETGRTAKDHIQDHVIELAKNRLLASDVEISQIAYQLGFEYPQSLNKLFKAKVGMSPSEYRKLN